MKLEMFLFCLALTVGIVQLGMTYLRGITRRVIQEQCGSGSGAEFWLRSADVLATSGSLLLVLAFGLDWQEVNMLQSVRMAMLCALGGVFVAAMFVASSVWRNVPRRAEPVDRAIATPEN